MKYSPVIATSVAEEGLDFPVRFEVSFTFPATYHSAGM